MAFFKDKALWIAEVIIMSLMDYWHFYLAAPFILPYLLFPIMPKNFKRKAVMELDCDVKKAYDVITADPRKCPVGGSMTRSLQLLKMSKDETAIEWEEDMRRDKFILTRDLGVKPGKSARISQVAESKMAKMTTRMEYSIESAGSGRCRITLDGHVEVRGSWSCPVYRMVMFLTGGNKNLMVDHLNLVANAAGVQRKWIA